MRVIRIQDGEGLSRVAYSHEECAEPGPGEVLVRVRACSLNYHDYMVAMGRIKVERGRIPLSDGAGEVVQVGAPLAAAAPDPSTRFAPGDRVLGTFFRNWMDGEPSASKCSTVAGEQVDGFATEYAVVPATALTYAPKNLDFMEAATLPCAGLTAWRALQVPSPAQAGDTVLVQGTGGVSIFALQFAKKQGASVVATSSSEEKLARLRALGADHVINYRTHPKWGAEVLEWTSGRGVDHVVEVGGAESLDQSITACRVGGRIAVIGLLAGTRGVINTARLMTKQIRLQGVVVGSRTDQMAMLGSVEQHQLKPVLDRAFELEDLSAAFRYQESGGHMGKIGVRIE